MDRIDSIKDERIAAARALTTRSGRTAAGRCLIEGGTLIRQVVAANAIVDYALCPEDGDDPDTSRDLARAGVPVHRVRAGLLRKLTGAGKPSEWLAVARLPAEDIVGEVAGDFAVVCEQVTDPGNLGTIARAACALGARDIVLTDETTDLCTRRVMSAARGTVLSCHVHRFVDSAGALASLHDQGFQVVAASPRGAHLQSLAPLGGRRIALVVGNETDGVSEATLAAADLVVQIPMAGAVESLNVGVAAGISIYELRMRMIMTMLTERIRNTLGRNMTAAAALARDAFDVHLRRVGDLDGGQAVLLMVLACDRSASREQVRADVGVGVEELGALVAPLEDRGYLTSAGDELTITGEGERTIAALWAVQERVEDELCDGFSVAEREQLQRLLRRVQDNAARVLKGA